LKILFIKKTLFTRPADLTSRSKSADPLVPSLPEEPRTHEELYCNLVAFLERRPPKPVTHLVSYHDRFPHLQSTNSFNLLLQHAIQHHDRGHSLLISRQLNRSQSCSPNTVTLRLWIRFLVEVGGDQPAWRALIQSAPRPFIDSIPSDVWKEFLRIAIPHLNQKSPETPQFPFGPGPLFHKFIETSLQRNSDAVKNLHFLRMLVARLVKDGFHTHAITITERILREAPTDIPQRQEELLLSVIHQFLSFGPVSTVSHFKMRQLLAKFLAIRPTLYYDAQTLLLLLRSLGRTKNPGWQGYQLLRAWIERWGPSSESDAVQLRIATYAIRYHRDDIALAMLSRRQHRSIARFESPPTVGTASPGIPRQGMRQIYPEHGQRRVMWGIISVKCKRATRLRSCGRGRVLDRTTFQKSLRRLNRRLEKAIALWEKRQYPS
jgi:hypothetical protein